jgi:hypothetical protein
MKIDTHRHECKERARAQDSEDAEDATWKVGYRKIEKILGKSVQGLGDIQWR